MREIVIDTETTGLDPNEGHCIVEVACIELMHHVPTGRKFHRYVNPDRDMPAEALAVHGITAEFLKSQPGFEAIADDLATFIGGDRLVIHNAEFHLAFIHAALEGLCPPALAFPFFAPPRLRPPPLPGPARQPRCVVPPFCDRSRGPREARRRYRLRSLGQDLCRAVGRPTARARFRGRRRRWDAARLAAGSPAARAAPACRLAR